MPLDDNPYLWRFVNQGEAWFRRLVNSKGGDGAPLFRQPAVAGDKIELMPSVQPTLPLDDFTKNPFVNPILINAPYLVRSKKGPDRFPMFDLAAVEEYIRQNFVSEPLLKPIAYWLGAGAIGYDDRNGRPDYNARVNTSIDTNGGAIYSGDVPIYEADAARVLDQNRIQGAFIWTPDLDPPVAIDLTQGEPSLIMAATGGVRRAWNQVTSQIVVFPFTTPASKPLASAVTVPALNRRRFQPDV